MGDAGSERSKAPSLPPRCPCGFWGSSKTMNLCSKCFAEKRNPHNEKDFQKKQPDDDSTPSTSNSQSDLFSGEINSDNSNTSLTTQTVNSNQQLSTELNVTSLSKEEFAGGHHPITSLRPAPLPGKTCGVLQKQFLLHLS